ncbi:streptokinase [Streptococcus pseudoporcinus]|uniref:Streptokinase n=1 Tax=Streptococcus pseudoporcinus TaxID=361101 RepID=A0A4U9XU82_9STRE|nr:hypothetical protein [Streptococcus pseudoporcinus]VTS17430.1 streptokinase [Streptococcus pseudoporcinus]
MPRKHFINVVQKSVAFSSVKHDDRTFTTIDDANNPESSYTVKAREHKPFDPGDDELLSGNQDTIKETYTIIRKDYLDDKGNLKYDIIDVHYIDASNNHLLLKQTYRLMPYEKHRIDFSNPYDYLKRQHFINVVQKSVAFSSRRLLASSTPTFRLLYDKRSGINEYSDCWWEWFSWKSAY